MPGKRVQFDDGTFEAITAVAPDTDKSFEEIADEAVADVLKKYACRSGERQRSRRA